MTASRTAAFMESSLIVFKTFQNPELWRSNFAGSGGKFMSPPNIREDAPPFPMALIPYVNLRPEKQRTGAIQRLQELHYSKRVITAAGDEGKPVALRGSSDSF
ncbi:hypothetical protein TNIN_276441 [Trichonephila inaurata madagascariensis]|uniref:Uncharacterized protein n=1 Tax=Trichonephila inaurata madagascariensis TaxID=2747483 RepID=A0A8X6XAZ8_9ARAC|nr:hypothetical protein TNIN_276441 [Trichonephila inaurata madagascariensis]